MNHTIDKAFEYYLANKPVMHSTKEIARHVKRMLSQRDLLELELYKLNGAVIRGFIHSLNVAESTSFTYYRTLTAVVSFYVKEHNIPLRMDGISSAIKAPKRRTADNDDFEEGGYLRLAEVKELIALDLPTKLSPKQICSEAEMRDYFIVVCFTGMSVSDLVKFDPAINIKEEDGKFWLKYRRTKNNKLARIPLSIPDIQPMEYINRLKWPPPFDVRTFQKFITIIGKKFGGRHMNPHLGRHSFGSVLLEVGFSMQAVSSMMGHSSIQTTERFYAKVSQDMITRELNAINQKLPPPPNGQAN